MLVGALAEAPSDPLGLSPDLAQAISTATEAGLLHPDHPPNEFQGDPPLGTSPRRVTRFRLAKRRNGVTIVSRVAGQNVYVRTGQYEDGSLGEIFIDLHKDGAALRSLMNAFAIAVSIGLQHGAPLQTFIDRFIHFRFSPNGIVTGHPSIKEATSVIDYIFRVLAIEFDLPIPEAPKIISEK
jgi:hypothetical protein